jgi:hypothetical protein
MKPTSHIALCCGLVLALFAGGCQTPRKAATPKEAWTNCITSILNSDKNLFLASTTGLPADKATEVFDLFSELADLGKKMQATYGKEAMKEAGGAWDDTFSMMLNAEIRQEGNRACAVPGKNHPQATIIGMDLCRVGDAWFVDLSKAYPDAEHPPFPGVGFLKFATESIRTVKAFVGKEGYPIEKLPMAIFMFPLTPEHHYDAGAPASPDPGGRPGAANPAAPSTPPAPARGLSPQEKLAFAQGHFAADLRLVKKHPWSRVPGADVQEAVKRIFGIRGGDSTGAPPAPADAEVNFLGLSKAQVLSLVGNPSDKSSSNGQDDWTYAYKGTQLTATITFRSDKVVKVFAVAGGRTEPPASIARGN